MYFPTPSSPERVDSASLGALLCVNARTPAQDRAEPQSLRQPQPSRTPIHSGQGRCLLFCCTALFCIPPTYGVVSRRRSLLPDYRAVGFGGGTAAGRTFCFPLANEQSVNAENLKKSRALNTDSPFFHSWYARWHCFG